MNKKQSKRQRDIKTKLMAAICMLLVSSIMMVSTTYAWFTLSTAPEVTGINTAVGANGNLEMALQPLDGASDQITSNVGDSTQAIIVRNTTWGNLVDVSDNATYGLNNVMLYPAALNTETTDAGLVIHQVPLATPAYGADGRITELEEKAITGVYNPDGKFLESYTGTGTATTINNAKGVRAIGVSSGMSDRQLAFRAALQTANTAATKARSVAAQSLTANGASLADLAIKHATGNGETYTATELAPLQTMINTLLGTADGTDGALEHIESALINYALAVALNGDSDDQYAATVTAFEAATIDTLADVMTQNSVSIAGYTGDTGYIALLKNSIANVESAKTDLENLVATKKTGITWNEFNAALYKLADTDEMTINGIAVNDVRADWDYSKYTDGFDSSKHYVGDGTNGTLNLVYKLEDQNNPDREPINNLSRLVNSALKGINLVLGTGAGVFADIADFSGDYSAAITLEQIEYGGLAVENLDATMKTETAISPVYLTAAQTAVGTFNAGTDGGTSEAISDFYGYIIDLAFRTNVSGSNLMLQQEAIDRIYSDSTNDATMGGGANMTFTSTDVNVFTSNQVKSLMNCIRIVFFDTDDRTIIGYARLDTVNAEMDNTTGAITANLYMTNADGDAAADQSIMAMEQNTVHELSVMVYLDGEQVTNADVANAASSMTGTMNLQFSSSATLTPMNYTELKEGTGDTGSSNTPSYTTSDVTTGTISDGYAAVVKHITDGTNHKLVAVITKDGAAVESGVTVKIGTADATFTEFGGVSGWVATGDATAPTTVDVTITATP